MKDMSVTALVVDDNVGVKDVFVELLYFSGINVIGQGSNGKEAVELYKKLSPDIVFMDVMMPKYDGFYGLEKIREHDPDARVVLVTASISVEIDVDGCNATAVISKPIDMKKVMSVISKTCPLKNL